MISYGSPRSDSILNAVCLALAEKLTREGLPTHPGDISADLTCEMSGESQVRIAISLESRDTIGLDMIGRLRSGSLASMSYQPPVRVNHVVCVDARLLFDDFAIHGAAVVDGIAADVLSAAGFKGMSRYRVVEETFKAVGPRHGSRWEKTKHSTTWEGADARDYAGKLGEEHPMHRVLLVRKMQVLRKGEWVTFTKSDFTLHNPSRDADHVSRALAKQIESEIDSEERQKEQRTAKLQEHARGVWQGALELVTECRAKWADALEVEEEAGDAQIESELFGGTAADPPDDAAWIKAEESTQRLMEFVQDRLRSIRARRLNEWLEMAEVRTKVRDEDHGVADGIREGTLEDECPDAVDDLCDVR